MSKDEIEEIILTTSKDELITIIKEANWSGMSQLEGALDILLQKIN